MNANVTKTNGVKLFALVAVLAMVFSGAAIVFSDNGVDAASDENIQVYGGMTLTEPQTFENVGIRVIENLIVDGTTLTINNGVFIVEKDITVTITNGGSIDVTGGLVTVNGTVVVTGTDDSETKKSTFNVDNGTPGASDKKYEDYGVVINGTINVTKGGTMTGEGTSPSILVNDAGNLNVTSTGGKISTISGLNVEVAVGGTFHFDGRAGETAMTVTSYGTGKTMVTASATITAGKSDTTDNSTSDLTFTTTSSSYTAYPVSGDSVLMREYALNVNGSVGGDDSIKFDSIAAVGITGDYFTSEDAAEAADYTYNDKVVGKVIVGKLDVKAGSDIILNTGSYVIVSESLNVGFNDETETGDNASKDVINGTLELRGTFTGNLLSCDTTAMGSQDGAIIINGGSATLKNYDDTFAGKVKILGAMWVDDDEYTTVYISDLATAITNASTAEIDEVSVIGLNGFVAGSDGRGSYIVDSDLVLPDGMNLQIICGLIINEGVSLTVPSDSSLSFDSQGGAGVYVNGKLVDYDTLSTTQVNTNIDFEVMSQVETEDDIINTYTTFAIALAETTEGTIYLYDDVVIDRNMTIPENVTVQFADKAKNDAAGISFEADTNYTFTINGTVFISGEHAFDVDGGKVSVNNVLKYEDVNAIENNSGENLVDGAYFSAKLGDDKQWYNYISSVTFAAENSSSINAEAGDNVIYISGNVSMGDATFSLGEGIESLTVSIKNEGNDKATGNITLNGVEFNSEEGIFTGSVKSEVTAGTSMVEFDKVKGAIIGYDSEESVDTTNTYMTLTSGASGSEGTITITSGTVNVIGNDVSFEKIAVATGATMIVPAESSITVTTPFMGEIYDYIINTSDDDAQKAAIKALFNGLGIDNNMPLVTDMRMQALAGLLVNGNVVVDGELGALVAYIDGTVNINKDATAEIIFGQVDGTVTAADGSIASYGVAIVNGTLAGEFSSTIATLVYPGSDITGALINSTDGETSTDDSTTIYINGAEYAVVYVQQDVDVPVMAILMFTDIAGVDIDTAKFYTDAEMTNQISNMDAAAVAKAYSDLIDAMRNGSGGSAALDAFVASFTGATVGDYDSVYISMEPSKVTGTITVYNGMSLYIDGKAIDNFMVYNETTKSYEYVLSVGTHQFSVQINPGLSGTPVVTLDGQTVTGSFTIADNAQNFQIVVTGNITQDSTVVVDGGDGDSSLGLTDYLLIILVILIVVMAIMVAMRLMRS